MKSQKLILDHIVTIDVSGQFIQQFISRHKDFFIGNILWEISGIISQGVDGNYNAKQEQTRSTISKVEPRLIDHYSQLQRLCRIS